MCACLRILIIDPRVCLIFRRNRRDVTANIQTHKKHVDS